MGRRLSCPSVLWGHPDDSGFPPVVFQISQLGDQLQSWEPPPGSPQAKPRRFHKSCKDFQKSSRGREYGKDPQAWSPGAQPPPLRAGRCHWQNTLPCSQPRVDHPLSLSLNTLPYSQTCVDHPPSFPLKAGSALPGAGPPLPGTALCSQQLAGLATPAARLSLGLCPGSTRLGAASPSGEHGYGGASSQPSPLPATQRVDPNVIVPPRSHFLLLPPWGLLM